MNFDVRAPAMQIHPSTKRLIDRLYDMTLERDIEWTKGADGSVIYNTERYSVTLIGDPTEVILASERGDVLDKADHAELTSTQLDDGTTYAELVSRLHKEAHRIARGAESAIDDVLATLDRTPPLVDTPEVVDTPAGQFDVTEPAMLEDAGGEPSYDELSSESVADAVATMANGVNREPEPAPTVFAAPEPEPIPEPVPEPTATISQPDTPSEPTPQPANTTSFGSPTAAVLGGSALSLGGGNNNGVVPSEAAPQPASTPETEPPAPVAEHPPTSMPITAGGAYGATRLNTPTPPPAEPDNPLTRAVNSFGAATEAPAPAEPAVIIPEPEAPPQDAAGLQSSLRSTLGDHLPDAEDTPSAEELAKEAMGTEEQKIADMVDSFTPPAEPEAPAAPAAPTPSSTIGISGFGVAANTIIDNAQSDAPAAVSDEAPEDLRSRSIGLIDESGSIIRKEEPDTPEPETESKAAVTESDDDPDDTPGGPPQPAKRFNPWR